MIAAAMIGQELKLQATFGPNKCLITLSTKSSVDDGISLTQSIRLLRGPNHAVVEPRLDGFHHHNHQLKGRFQGHFIIFELLIITQLDNEPQQPLMGLNSGTIRLVIRAEIDKIWD